MISLLFLFYALWIRNRHCFYHSFHHIFYRSESDWTLWRKAQNDKFKSILCLFSIMFIDYANLCTQNKGQDQCSYSKSLHSILLNYISVSNNTICSFVPPEVWFIEILFVTYLLRPCRRIIIMSDRNNVLTSVEAPMWDRSTDTSDQNKLRI